MTRTLRSIIPVLGVLSGTGCFSYRTVPVTELGPGRTVRAYLTAEQAREIREVLTLHGRHLTGTVVEGGHDRLLLDVRVASPSDGTVDRPLSQRVAVPVPAILELEERVLNRWKTALVVGGAAAVVGGLVAWQIGEHQNSPLRNPRDPPDAARIPLFGITLTGVP